MRPGTYIANTAQCNEILSREWLWIWVRIKLNKLTYKQTRFDKQGTCCKALLNLDEQVQQVSVSKETIISVKRYLLLVSKETCCNWVLLNLNEQVR